MPKSFWSWLWDLGLGLDNLQNICCDQYSRQGTWSWWTLHFENKIWWETCWCLCQRLYLLQRYKWPKIIFWWSTVRTALYYMLLKPFWPFKWKARRGRTSIFYLIFYVLHCTNFWPFRWKAWRGILFFRGWCWGKFKGFRKRPFLSGLYTSFLLQNFPNHFTLNHH